MIISPEDCFDEGFCDEAWGSMVTASENATKLPQEQRAERIERSFGAFTSLPHFGQLYIKGSPFYKMRTRKHALLQAKFLICFSSVQAVPRCMDGFVKSIPYHEGLAKHPMSIQPSSACPFQGNLAPQRKIASAPLEFQFSETS